MIRGLQIIVAFMVFTDQVHPQSGIPSGTSELRLALKKLGVLGTALYVAAHPDDENTSVISYLANGRFVRTAYLSMTRGEGGQNLIGPEQGSLLGILRTQELLSARRIDGGEQFFTSAIDFGYSKTSEETIRIWGRERIVGDIVWVIRSFRPDIIMTRFADSLGTHGNHTGSAILAKEAFEASGDPTKFPDQLRFVLPWKPKRLVFNVFRFGSSGMDPTSNAVKTDVGTYSAILGESFTEISGRSRSMHKSQGFGAAENRGKSIQAFEPRAGISATSDLFDGIDIGWSRIGGGSEVERIIKEAHESFDPENPAGSIGLLLKAYTALGNLTGDSWIGIKRNEIRDVILGCAGVHVEAIARSFSASPGDTLEVTTTVVNRSDEDISWRFLQLPFSGKDSSVGVRLQNNVPSRVRSSVFIPRSTKYSQPYWLQSPPLQGSYVIEDLMLRGTAQNSPMTAGLTLEIRSTPVDLDVPIRYKWVDRVQGELTRPLVIVPPVSVNLTESVFVFTGDHEKEIRLVLAASGRAARGSVTLEAPSGWNVSPPQHSFSFKEQSDELAVVFKISPSGSALSGRFKASVRVGGETSSLGMVSLDYHHIDPQVYFPQAEGKLVRIPMKTPVGHIGYIEGSGDDIPAALQQLGYSVKFLSDADLEFSDLKQFDAIVSGVRAYNTRSKLRVQQKRLMEYVRNGGRYIVQYVTREREKSENLGPYSFEISRDRVTVEEAPVKFLLPDHPILNSPNKITGEDFKDWVQERGLYFADTWDKKYEAILASNDPGEDAKAGGLLAGTYGKGTYIYTGYSFFRQLPAGVPGAYRLFVNLLSGK